MITGELIMRELPRYRGWVACRVRAHQVDDVLQAAAVEAWEKRESYDAARGEFGAWLFGCVRMALGRVLRAEARHVRHRDVRDVSDASLATLLAVPDIDVLEVLVEQLRVREVLARLHRAVTDEEWVVLLDLSLGGLSVAEVSEVHGMSQRRVHDIHLRVRALAAVLVAAVRRAEAEDEAVTRENLPEQVVACLPAEFAGWAQVLVRLLRGELVTRAAVAAQLGISEKSVCNRYPLLYRLVSVASEVLVSQVSGVQSVPE